MDIHKDNRGFLEIHVWISYGFSDQGPVINTRIILCLLIFQEPNARHLRTCAHKMGTHYKGFSQNHGH